jgi:hypothetical protein
VKFYVPSIGDKFQLTKDFEFSCFAESRNLSFLEKVRPDFVAGLPNKWGNSDQSCMVTIPKGIVLTVARIYIRNGKKDFDSITFSIKKDAKVWQHSGRFWAKLYDINENIEFEKVDD